MKTFLGLAMPAIQHDTQTFGTFRTVTDAVILSQLKDCNYKFGPHPCCAKPTFTALVWLPVWLEIGL